MARPCSIFMISGGPKRWIDSFSASRVDQSTMATRFRKPRRIGMQVISAHPLPGSACLRARVGDLAGPLEPQPTQQTGVGPEALCRPAGIWAPDALGVHCMALVLQVPGHLPDTVERRLKELLDRSRRLLRKGLSGNGSAASARGSTRSRPAAHNGTTTARSTAGGTAPRPAAPDGCVQTSRASLSDPGLELSRQEIVGDGQLSDLGMQIPNRVLVDLGPVLPATLEDVRHPLKQCLPPLLDHRRTTPACGGQFRHPVLTPHGFQRHASLEARITVPAFRLDLISSFQETSRRQFVVCVAVRITGRSPPRSPWTGLCASGLHLRRPWLPWRCWRAG